jgi:hypothetical protein
MDEGLIINTLRNEIERRKSEEKAEEKEYKRRQNRFNRLMVVFTGLLFVTSAFSDWLMWRYVSLTKQSTDTATDVLRQTKTSGETATHQMWQAVGNMNWLAKEMMNAVQQAQGATRISQGNAKRALDASVGSARTAQRAWIAPIRARIHIAEAEAREGDTITRERITGREGLSDIPFIEAELHNVGETPAVHTRARVKILLRPTRVGKDERIEIPPKIEAESEGIVSKGGLMAFAHIPAFEDTPPRQLTATDIAAIRGGSLLIISFGRVEYQDVFGERHWTTFCFEYDPTQNKMKACSYHNEMN